MGKLDQIAEQRERLRVLHITFRWSLLAVLPVIITDDRDRRPVTRHRLDKHGLTQSARFRRRAFCSQRAVVLETPERSLGVFHICHGLWAHHADGGALSAIPMHCATWSKPNPGRRPVTLKGGPLGSLLIARLCFALCSLFSLKFLLQPMMRRRNDSE
jgi:hypothetical protein